jgi:hypothetical protein
MQLELGTIHSQRHAEDEDELNSILAHKGHWQTLNQANINYIILFPHNQTSPRFQRGCFAFMSSILPWSDRINITPRF